MSKKTDETKDLMVLQTRNFLICEYPPSEIADLVQENFGGAKLMLTDLDRIRIPSGGGIHYVLPSLEEGEQPVKSFEGVIIHIQPHRAWWKNSIDDAGGGVPPDCYSPDGHKGIPISQAALEAGIGGACASCPMNEWRSDGKRGKGCKEMRLVFIVRPETLLPAVLILPPTSIKKVNSYLQALTNRLIKKNTVITRFGLQKIQNKDNIEYAQAIFSMATKLDKKSIDAINAYVEPLKNIVSMGFWKDESIVEDER